MNICKTCKHFMPDKTQHNVKYAIKYGVCRHPLFQIVDKVSGEITYENASFLRKDHDVLSKQSCGPEGIFYEKENSLVILQREFMIPWILEFILLVLVLYVAICVILYVGK